MAQQWTQVPNTDTPGHADVQPQADYSKHIKRMLNRNLRLTMLSDKENIPCPSRRSRQQRVVRRSSACSVAKSEGAVRRGSLTPPSTRLVLPKRLPRPTPDVAAVIPTLENVPLEYIREKLRLEGPKLLQGIAGASPIVPAKKLPTEVEVQMVDMSTDLPTHVFAVHSSQGAAIRTEVLIYPIHALVFAAMTSKVNQLPTSPKQETDSSVILPVVPLCIPSPATFALLQSYLYTQRPDILLSSLLPILSMPAGIPPVCDELAPRLATAHTMSTLLTQARQVHGIWGNAIALGVMDEPFWDTLEIAWEVILKALAIRASKGLSR